MIKILFFLIFVFTLYPLPSTLSFAADSGYQNYQDTIRVALFRDVRGVRLDTIGKIYAIEIKSNQKYLLLGNSRYEIKYNGDGLIGISRQILTSPVKLISIDGQDKMRINGNYYKGEILIKTNSNETITVIEMLPIEEYLYGVLPFEMSPNWPVEALKSQAVISRTFALKNLKSSGDYDITSGQEMQVYSGLNKINSKIIEAVNSTSGEVLKYKGQLIMAYFHACCGGHTTSQESAWGQALIKPLAGVPDPFCRHSNNYSWRFYIPTKDILSKLQRKDMVLKIKGIRISKRDKSGRALKLIFTTDKKNITINASDFRKWFGSSEIKSTFIMRIVPYKNGYEFIGRGWGHGVGLCQEGAKELAQRGKNYKKILKHYYPGATIENIND